MSEPAEPAVDAVTQSLVSYLDGELDAEDSRALEERIARDPALRRRLQLLQRSWDMLDGLPRADVNEQFTRTTVAMVAVAAAEDLQRQQRALPAMRRRRWLLTAASMAVAALLGYMLIGALRPDRNEQLLRDLPTIENVELYDHAGSVAFLRQLDQDSVFADDEATGPDSPTNDSLADRRQRVERLSAAEKEQLAQKFERFQALSPQRQQDLRQLNDSVAADSQAEALRRTLARYHEWLKTLSPTDRIELLEMPDDKRLARIKELKQEQTRQLARTSSESRWRFLGDGPGVVRWGLDYVAQHEDELLQYLPKMHAEELQKDEFKRRRSLLALAAAGWRGDDTRLTDPLSAADLQQLRERLSPDTQKLLDAERTPQAKTHLVGNWLQAAMRFGASFGGGGMGRGIAGEWLQKFEQELTDADKQRLKNLSPEDRAREVRKLFFERHPPGDPKLRGGRGKPGGMPGDERGKPGDEPGRPGAGPPDDRGGIDRPNMERRRPPAVPPEERENLERRQ